MNTIKQKKLPRGYAKKIATVFGVSQSLVRKVAAGERKNEAITVAINILRDKHLKKTISNINAVKE